MSGLDHTSLSVSDFAKAKAFYTAALAPLGPRLSLATDVDTLLERLLDELAAGDLVVLMSNGSFQGLPERLERGLAARAAAS